MLALNNKLMRDLWRQRLQGLAIVMIIACGVASQVTAVSLMATLTSAMDKLYDDQLFAHLFVRVRSTPLSVVSQLREISGVAAVQPRIVLDVRLQSLRDKDDPISAKLIGVPSSNANRMNRLLVRRGRGLLDIRKHEVLVSEIFADARGIQIGDQLSATIQGTQTQLTVAGIANSPEYLFQIREGAGVPDNKRYGILWMRYQDLALATNMEGAFNEAVLRVDQPSHTLPSLLEHVERTLEPYGVISAVDRAQQDSHRYTSQAIAHLRSVAIVPPGIFLAVAAFLIYIATSRLLKTEREQIAMLRAFGYTTHEIGRHYFSFVLVLVLLGCLLGLGMGLVLAGQAIQTYHEIYRFPGLPLRTYPWAVACSIVAACLAGCLGAAYSVLKAANLPPAMGLRPEAPLSFRPTLLDRWAPWFSLPPISQMVLRGVGRWPLRTLLGILGIALGIAVMILGGYTQGAIAYVVDFEFFLTRRYDVMVQFADRTPQAAIDELRNLPGVLQAVPFDSRQCEIQRANVKRTVTLIGLEAEQSIVRPVTARLQGIPVPSHGVALSAELADVLRLKPGDAIELKCQMVETQPVNFLVESIITDYAGLNAYVERSTLQHWQGRVGLVSGAWLQVDASQLDAINRELNRRPRVVGVTVKSKALEDFRASEGKNLLLFRVFNMLFSSVIAIGAVYSIASISLVERYRELAILRVLGYSASEVGRVLIGELVFMAVVAIPIGCAAGYLFAALATWMLNSETQRIPLLIQPATYASSILVSLLSASISAAIVQRRVNRMDCGALLNSKD